MAQNTPTDRIVSAGLDHLRALSPSIELDYAPLHSGSGADAELVVRLQRQGRTERFLVQITRTHLSYALASGVVEQARRVEGNLALFSPYVPGPIGRHLVAHGVSYVDAVGNCHLETRTGGLLAHVEGRKPDRELGRQSGGRVPSYQLIFVILAQPELLNEPIRQIAAAAGIGKSAAADQLRRLTHQGIVARTASKRTILRRRELLDRWLSAYHDVVRPAWLHGRYRTQATDPETVERQILEVWDRDRWVLGGGAAAWRMNKFYRGEETVIHVDGTPTDQLRRLRALPTPHGPLEVLVTPGTTSYAGLGPQLAHPLLVYTEMVTSADPRMREAAGTFREQFLSTEQ